MSSSTTIFIAVQCYQCSTMQVKQRKKISNKWNCAVCGEKQSLTRVHAQGYMAKDVRRFVQSFNLSRRFADHDALIDLGRDRRGMGDRCDDEEEQEEKEEECVVVKKRRMDWTEYVEREEEEEDGLDLGFQIQCEGKRMDEPEIVTQLPQESFKKPRKKLFVAGDKRRTLDGAVASRREGNCSSLGKNATRWSQPGSSSDRSRWEGAKNQLQDPKQSQARQLKVSRQASKWSAYMTDDEVLCSIHSEASIKDDCFPQSEEDSFALSFDMIDQSVDEDIHPDFA